MLNYFNILQSAKVPVDSFIEIGSRDGDDANTFAKAARVKTVYVIEPAPGSYQDIVKKYPSFKVFDFALSNRDGFASFNNVVEKDQTKRGVSSLMARPLVYGSWKTETIQVKVKTGQAFLTENNISRVDACKIDVEGHAFEVLKGFGNSLEKIKSIHVESEMAPIWDKQRTFADVRHLLVSKDFEMFYFIQYNHPTTQSDSIWIHRSVL